MSEFLKIFLQAIELIIYFIGVITTVILIAIPICGGELNVRIGKDKKKKENK